MPDCAQTANRLWRAVWHSRAVWHLAAPFGIPRRSAFRAVRHFAPFGIPRRLALRR